MSRNRKNASTRTTNANVNSHANVKQSLIDTLTIDQRRAQIVDLLSQLKNTTDQRAKKRIRRMLRTRAYYISRDDTHDIVNNQRRKRNAK
jgi:hypothetical protein